MDLSWAKFEELMRAEMRKVYSEIVVEQIMAPVNLGTIEKEDGFARITGPCGDTMEIWLKLADGTISEARFMTDGCGPSIASGNMVAELARGKSIAEAQKIDQQAVLDALDGLPEDSRHCALLAANTLQQAITNSQANGAFPAQAGQ